VVLSATVQDITAVLGDPAYDANAGDIRNATVSFVNRDADNAVLCSASVGLVSLADTKTGTAACAWSVNIGNANSVSVAVGIVVNGYYTRNLGDDNQVVTVSKPVSSFITGGGYLVMSASAGQIAGTPGTKNNFGFNVKYNKGGTNLQGAVNIIVRSGGRVYQIKSTAIDTLGTNATTGSAEFTSKANITDVTDPLNPISIAGSGDTRLKMSLKDNGEPGRNDNIAITVWNSRDGGLWFSSAWDGVKTVPQLLAGGNLSVR
jgi:hypothetical protein